MDDHHIVVVDDHMVEVLNHPILEPQQELSEEATVHHSLDQGSMVPIIHMVVMFLLLEPLTMIVTTTTITMERTHIKLLNQ